jgi:UDP-N-acetylmuramoylalanine--D-glutamate ligase
MKDEMGIHDKHRVLVVGLGKSGEAAASLLASRGYEVTVTDDDAEKLAGFGGAGVSGAEERKIRTLSPDECLASLERFDCLVLSPGVPMEHPLVEKSKRLSIYVTGELEVAYQFSAMRIVAVTGTNGKSTVTDLVGRIMKLAGGSSVVAGNIGTPFSAVVEEGGCDTAVLEVSSFQLDTIDRFKADVAVCLNVTPDHLDRYDDSFEKYTASKKRILNRADDRTWYVYNRMDPVCESFTRDFPGRTIPFSRSRLPGDGVFFEEGMLVRSMGGKEEALMSRDEFMPVGVHNLENALAAVGIAAALGLKDSVVREALRGYRPLAHRMELVRVEGGVAYINDSKATNVDAALKSIASIDGKAIVIMGGRDKNADFSALVSVLDRVKEIILIGEAADKISRALAGSVPMENASDLQEAVEKARAHAEPGETVLLAPACASFDMFKDYKERGEVFKRLVNDL